MNQKSNDLFNFNLEVKIRHKNKFHFCKRCEALLVHSCFCQYFQNTSLWIVFEQRRAPECPRQQSSEHVVLCWEKGVECIWLDGRKVINYALLNETIINCNKTRIKGRDVKSLSVKLFCEELHRRVMLWKMLAHLKNFTAFLLLSKYNFSREFSSEKSRRKAKSHKTIICA